MPLMPLDADDANTNDDSPMTLTGVEVSSGDREHILEALSLNRQLLHEPQPDAEVDEAAVRDTIDALLDQLRAAE